MKIMVQRIAWGDRFYAQTLALRYEVLRKPIGLVFDPVIFEHEASDVHIVALENNWVVGCMVLSITNEGVKMRQVAVNPKKQRSGIGASMVQFAEEIASSKKHKRMVLHARDSAISFYLAQGYRIFGFGFNEVGIPHHAMVKDLVD